jgi:hypothetical protein
MTNWGGDVVIPDFDLLGGRLPSVRDAPLEHLIVPSTLKRLLLQRFIVNLKKAATDAVKSGHGTLRLDPRGREFPLMERTNFIEHSTEAHDSSDLTPGAAQAGNPRGASQWLTGRRRVVRETRRTPLVSIEEVEEGQNCTIRYSRLLSLFAQASGALVAPTALLHEGVPYFGAFIGRLSAVSAGPLEKRLVCSSLDCLGGKRSIIDLEKAAAAPVKAAGVGLANNGWYSEGNIPAAWSRILSIMRPK